MHVENNEKERKKKGRDSCNVFWKMERTNKRLLQREIERGFWGLSMNKTLKPCVYVGGPYASYETDLSGF